MRGEPALAFRHEFLELGVADPIVFLAVENRQEHVEMDEQIPQAAFRGERNPEVRALTPLGEVRIERQSLGVDGIPERLEETTEECLSAAARKDRQLDAKRKFGLGELGAVSTRAVESRTEHARECDTQERRSDVRTVVDVLPERSGIALCVSRASDEADGVELEQ
jgi:hypothetical protein